MKVILTSAIKITRLRLQTLCRIAEAVVCTLGNIALSLLDGSGKVGSTALSVRGASV